MKRQWVAYGARISSAVTAKAIVIYLGFLAGSKLDALWGTSPLMLILGLALGFALGLFYLFRVLDSQKPKN